MLSQIKNLIFNIKTWFVLLFAWILASLLFPDQAFAGPLKKVVDSFLTSIGAK